ncbi:MAG: hypothetical protein JJ896_15780 [Rhodothermales bacterium]|nr:hypothetical protein [Rhodothermales bacterium]MBO6781115.1 hypothetical protein [Rhodothermales bacterium]
MRAFLLIALLLPAVAAAGQDMAPAPATDGLISRFERADSGLLLERPSSAGTYMNVVGRRSAAFGYEHRPFEVWVYPMKIVRDFQLEFKIQDYPLDISGNEILAHVEVRPESAVLTYRHAAFTVKQTIFAPVDEMGVVMLLDVDAVRPIEVIGSFRPDLRLMWPAGLQTGGIFWDADSHLYGIVEDSQQFGGAIMAPGARDISVMPYQEEPRDVPNRFILDVDPQVAATHLYPIAIAGSIEGIDGARETASDLIARAADLYQGTAAYYRDLLDRTVTVDTPDDRLDEAFAWAKIGTEKGLVTNPYLGTGFVAGYRTAGSSERPGFAWYFGRDAMWTSYALMAYGDYEASRSALDFLAGVQTEDGRIPHEVSQSATLIDWFNRFGYAYHSADASPLYVVAHGDYYRLTGDREYLSRSWESVLGAYNWAAATDLDDDGLLNNYQVGHGWVEAKAFEPEEEIYMQGIWIEANRAMAQMAEAMGHTDLAREASARAERTSAAMEAAYWMEDAGRYKWATPIPDLPDEAESYFTASTSLTGVPLWWGTAQEDRAHLELDALGGGAVSTDWGARLFSEEESPWYDPLSYHTGSVWPLFTGWVSMGGYTYARPHIGHQALMATALLTRQDALGYVTELLSGDFNTAFGRSSHHQIWSEAMVVTPLIRGMLGLDMRDAGSTLVFSPQLPADWGSVRVDRIPAGDGFVAIQYGRLDNTVRIAVSREGGGGPSRLIVEPAMPQDAQVGSIQVNGEEVPFTIADRGDRRFVRVEVPFSDNGAVISITRSPGSDAYVTHEPAGPGARSTGLRILRSQADADAISLTVEGLPGKRYLLGIRTPHRVQPAPGTDVRQVPGRDALVALEFDGEPGRYVRRVLRFPLDTQ